MPHKPDSPHAVVHAGSGTVRTEPLPTGSSARTPTQAREKEEISAVERSICPGCPCGVEQIEWTVCTRAPATAHRGTPAQHIWATLTAEAVRATLTAGATLGARIWKVRPTRLDEAHERSYDENAHARAVGARGQRATERRRVAKAPLAAQRLFAFKGK